MKKFENPIMTISMFEVENVVTGSGVDQPTIDKTDAKEAAKTYLNENNSIALGNILVF